MLDPLAVSVMDKPGWAGIALPRCFSHGKQGHRTSRQTLITGSVKPLMVPQLVPLRVSQLQAQQFAPISFQSSAPAGFRGIQLLPAHPIPTGNMREGVRAHSSLPVSPSAQHCCASSRHICPDFSLTASFVEAPIILPAAGFLCFSWHVLCEESFAMVALSPSV